MYIAWLSLVWFRFVIRFFLHFHFFIWFASMFWHFSHFNFDHYERHMRVLSSRCCQTKIIPWFLSGSSTVFRFNEIFECTAVVWIAFLLLKLIVALISSNVFTSKFSFKSFNHKQHFSFTSSWNTNTHAHTYTSMLTLVLFLPQIAVLEHRQYRIFVLSNLPAK